MALDVLVLSQPGGAVEVHLAHVASLGERFLEKRKLAMALMRNLRMQAKGGPDPRRSVSKPQRAFHVWGVVVIESTW